MPEVSVIQRSQALSGFTGRIVLRRRKCKSNVKIQGPTLKRIGNCTSRRLSKVSRIPGGGVKSIDIGRNTNGEGSLLGYT